MFRFPLILLQSKNKQVKRPIRIGLLKIKHKKKLIQHSLLTHFCEKVMQ